METAVSVTYSLRIPQNIYQVAKVWVPYLFRLELDSALDIKSIFQTLIVFSWRTHVAISSAGLGKHCTICTSRARFSFRYQIHILDSKSVQLKNTRGNIQRRAGKALYNLHESMPGDWQTFTDNNIRLAEQVGSK